MIVQNKPEIFIEIRACLGRWISLKSCNTEAFSVSRASKQTLQLLRAMINRSVFTWAKLPPRRAQEYRKTQKNS